MFRYILEIKMNRQQNYTRIFVKISKIIWITKRLVLYLYYENHRNMNTEYKYLPTNSELEILQILWEQGSATVREVFEKLKPERETGYTTTLKTMQIMLEKGILSRDTSSRTHIYSPLVTREKTQEHFLNKMIDGLFSGSASRLVIGALDNKKMSDDEIVEIQEYLKQFESGRP